MSPSAPAHGRAALTAVLGDPELVSALRACSEVSFVAASHFWQVPLESGHLTPRMAELVLVAMHASSAGLDADALARHIGRARTAGATDEEIVDVLVTIVAVANHALYATVPVLEEELRRAGVDDAPNGLSPGELAAAKQEFMQARGFWNAEREMLARLVPEYFQALNRISTVTWESGPLSAKERQLVCIAVNSTVTHNYGPGLRMHIRSALDLGATREEILQVFQLAALLGLEGYVVGARALFASPNRR